MNLTLEMYSIDIILESLIRCEIPSIQQIKFICEKASEILIKEENVVILYPPVSLVGDIHGQFYDLLELFEVGDHIPNTNYCFLGDYVDRGYYSLETFLLLLTIKVRYPRNITLLRGNHESRGCTLTYGFYNECRNKIGFDVYKYCTNVFDLLPICAIVGQELFCVHAGLSPQIKSIDEINQFNRKQEIEGPITDLLWSDPEDDIKNWAVSPRGAGFLFGKDAVKEFNKINSIKCIIRAHQPADPYYYMFNKRLCSIWGAPNYLYHCGNNAAILEINENMDRYFNVFEAAPDSVQRFPEDKPPIPEYFL